MKRPLPTNSVVALTSQECSALLQPENLKTIAAIPDAAVEGKIRNLLASNFTKQDAEMLKASLRELASAIKGRQKVKTQQPATQKPVEKKIETKKESTKIPARDILKKKLKKK